MPRSVSDGSIRVVVLCLGAFFLLLAGRLVFVQCFRNDPSLGNLDTLLSNSRHVRLAHIPQQRGHIYDRNRVPLTSAHRYYQVFVDPMTLDAEAQWDVATNLVNWFSIPGNLPKEPGIDAASLDARFTRDRERKRKYIPIGTTTDDNLAEYIRRLGEPGRPFHGLGALKCYEREYPMGSAASHVVGFINKEDTGVVGIEMRFNRLLTGAPGHIWKSVNASGREIRHLRDGYLPPRNGVDIELTIDHYLQHAVDALIDEAWRNTQSLAAWALVYDCRTGEVLAMADRPTVDPLDYNATDLETWKNRCVGFRYEPGSVMKPVTICGALTAGVITTNTVIDTGHGPWHFGGYLLRDHFDGPGRPYDFIRKSSNKGTAMIAEGRMGRELLADTIQRAGFGSRTGIELPAEDRGNIGRPEKWTPLNLTRISIGQSIDVTAIQLASAYGAIANNGVRMRPKIVRRILDPDGRVLRDFQPEAFPEPIFSREATRAMLDMLEAVVTVDPVTRAHGTGRRAAVSGYRVGGKTGTAQMLVNRHYSSSDYHASFCGILPIDDPHYIIVVTLERPIGLHGGGDVAAPVFSQIATQVARYYGLPTALHQEDFFDLGEPEPDPEGLLDPFPDRVPEEEPNYLDETEVLP